MSKMKTIRVNEYHRDWLNELKVQMLAPSISDTLTQIIIHLRKSDQTDNLIERGRHCYASEALEEIEERVA